MRALFGCPVLAQGHWEKDKAVLVGNGVIRDIVAVDRIPDDAERVFLDGGYLAPGFIDLQVNGGGGVLLNDAPTVETIGTIAKAHRAFGTTGFLPTLISDTPEMIARTILSVDEAISLGVPGVLGIHIEGPVLNVEKKGVHDPKRFRDLDDDFIDVLTGLKNGKTLVTLAPEKTAPGQIAELVKRGVVVWAGHTNADYETVLQAIQEGLSGFTHLYNAMSPLTGRAPGVVGAALDSGDTWAGVIADGFHVHDASLRAAIKCKGVQKTILVTDAMPSVGAPAGFDGFDLFGEWVDATRPRLTIESGNLAGSSLDMMSAVRYAHGHLGVSLADAIFMASLGPAQAIGLGDQTGDIAEGRQAGLVHITDEGGVDRSWVKGEESVIIPVGETVQTPPTARAGNVYAC
ncbi:MAG: N-acetylglucosamine-6-phosphate deacetylase [Hyphomonadaceae bacterium]|nr:N-acetylglucosamine-6-phosphate deacetylase [Hyphomonadaceae bacterium]MBC6412644.1 N-acetylglucosamine-6-phosphate deacetylase [Hyphomonadaceae bacterium]